MDICKKIKLSFLILGFVFMLYEPIFAGLNFDVDLNFSTATNAFGGTLSGDNLIKNTFQNFVSKYEDMINEDYLSQFEPFLDKMGNAMANVAAVGFPIDVVNLDEVGLLGGYLSLGATIGLSVTDPKEAVESGDNRVPSVGFFGNINLSAIFRIPFVKALKKWDFGIKYFKVSRDFDFNDASLNASFTSFGLQARYKLVGSKKLLAGFLGFGGISVGPRIDYMKVTADLRTKRLINYSETYEISGVSYNVSGSLSPFTLAFSEKVFSVGGEIKSYFQLLWILRPYLGLNASLIFGSMDINADMSMNLKASASGATATTLTKLGFPSSAEATATGRLTGDFKPKGYQVRLIVGTGINLWLVSAIIEGYYDIITKTLSAQLGFKITF